MKGSLRNLREAINPIELGQTKCGLFLAALFVMLWQFSIPLQAQVPSSGSSENDYFRLEWDYSLATGQGQLRIEPRGPWSSNWRRGVLEHLRFTTTGVAMYEYYAYYEDPTFSDPTVIGEENGMLLYGYDLLDPVAMPLPDYYYGELGFGFDFPNEGVELRATEVSYDGYTLSAAGGLVNRIPNEPMPFVTIQAIPEPATAAIFGLGAAALAVLHNRRKDS